MSNSPVSDPRNNILSPLSFHVLTVLLKAYPKELEMSEVQEAVLSAGFSRPTRSRTACYEHLGRLEEQGLVVSHAAIAPQRTGRGHRRHRILKFTAGIPAAREVGRALAFHAVRTLGLAREYGDIIREEAAEAGVKFLMVPASEVLV